MRKFLVRALAFIMTAAFMFPAFLPDARAVNVSDTVVRVGLYYGSSALVGANLWNQSDTGNGAGYRFGYFDNDLNFVELGRTGPETIQISMVKTTDVYYNGSNYEEGTTGSIVLGCYHVVAPEQYSDFDSAKAAADAAGGFVAWIDGTYQVRLGAYLTLEQATEAAKALGETYTVKGTSSYGVNVVATGTARILFQFDGGSSRALGVMPDVTGAEQVQTWFKGYRFSGGFRYERIGGGNMTVVNVVDLETYVKGVIPYEMNNQWPMEALKAQAVCARSYAITTLNNHNSYHFDVCATTHCQVYHGVGSDSANYQANDRTDSAVESTAGEVAWYNGSVAQTFFSSSHGGASESVTNVWGSSLSKYPYLCGVEDPYEADTASINPYSSWTVRYSASELASRLKTKGYGDGSPVTSVNTTLTDLGNVKSVTVTYSNGKSNTISGGDTIRSVFVVSSIRFSVAAQGGSAGGGDSSWAVNGSDSLNSLEGAWVISGSGTVEQSNGSGLYSVSGSGQTDPLEQQSGSQQGVSGSTFVFTGAGNGHQLGMSQYGAYAMDQRGYSYKEIVEFYFPGTTVGTAG